MILAADVIEHIKNDKKAIQLLYRSLKPKGKIIITVPAFQFLFSQKDKELRHFRRYNLKNLKMILKNFKLIKISYFNFFLFLPLSILILIFKFFNFNFIDDAEKTPNKTINKLLYIIFSFEKYFINNFNFPFGLSIIFIGQKK